MDDIKLAKDQSIESPLMSEYKAERDGVEAHLLEVRAELAEVRKIIDDMKDTGSDKLDGINYYNLITKINNLKAIENTLLENQHILLEIEELKKRSSDQGNNSANIIKHTITLISSLNISQLKFCPI